MSSNVANEESAWVSGVIRPVAHSSEVRRSRKAEKNRKERKRRQARRQECIQQAAGAEAAAAAAAIVAGSCDGDIARHVEENGQRERRELHDTNISASPSGLPQQTEAAGTDTTVAADVLDMAEASHNDSGATQAPSAPAADFVAAGVDGRDPEEGQAGIQPSQQQSQPPQSQPPQSQPPQSRRSHFVEEGTAEFEEWARARARLTAWARAMDAKLKTADGPQPVENRRRYAPPAQQYSLPILSRTAAFAVQCGFGPGVAPQLLQHVVRTVFGEEFARNVVALSLEDVDYMFAVFWAQQVASLDEAERLFRLAAGFGGDGGLTMDDLRPLITAAVQSHPEFLMLTVEDQARYLDNVLAMTFSRLGWSGVIKLDDLRRSDFAASLNAIGRHEIGLEESIYFSRFISLPMVQTPGYQQPSLSPYGRGGAVWGMEHGGGLSACNIGNPNVFWATGPSTVAVGSC